jgi:hypothetical protein
MMQITFSNSLETRGAETVETRHKTVETAGVETVETLFHFVSTCVSTFNVLVIKHLNARWKQKTSSVAHNPL